MLPGPGTYNNMKEMKDLNYQAKSILGGTLKPIKKKGEPDSPKNKYDTPGPDAYTINPINKIPGFVIHQDSHKVAKDEDPNKEPVGPQRYDPVNPNHGKTSHNRVRTIGVSERKDLIAAQNMPGPGKYVI